MSRAVACGANVKRNQGLSMFNENKCGFVKGEMQSELLGRAVSLVRKQAMYSCT